MKLLTEPIIVIVSILLAAFFFISGHQRSIQKKINDCIEQGYSLEYCIDTILITEQSEGPEGSNAETKE